MTQRLREIGLVVHNILPDSHRINETNKPGMYPHLIAVEQGPWGYLLCLDYSPEDKMSRLLQVRFHSPAEVKVLAKVPDARYLVYMEKLHCVILLNPTKSLLTVHHFKPITPKIDSLTGEKLRELAEYVGLPTEGRPAELKKRFHDHIDQIQSRPSPANGIKLSLNLQISCIGKVENRTDKMICADDLSRSIFEITFTSNLVYLCGNVILRCRYPDEVLRIESLCVKSDRVIFSCSNGIYACADPNREPQLLLSSNSEHLGRPGKENSVNFV